jgi:exportin-1
VLRNNIDLIETMTNSMELNENQNTLVLCTQGGLNYMIQLSSVPEEELFKISTDFWNFLSNNILMKQGMQKQTMEIPVGNAEAPLDLSSFAASAATTQMHIKVYPEIMEKVMDIMIDFMARPKEVLVSVDEDGEVEEEVFEDTEQVVLYETMRETLIYLTNLYPDKMNSIFTKRLEQIKTDKEYFTFERLNKLCWALGSITGCFDEANESKFVIMTIKELLNLCEKTQGKGNKAQVATDIMYVTGQFPKFLLSHWAFLKTVINKLIEFMKESHPGVQDMASETFLKISKLTKHMFVTQQDKDPEPFVVTLIRDQQKITADLKIHQLLMFYEGIGWMISQQQD